MSGSVLGELYKKALGVVDGIEMLLKFSGY
jgi:hypothetical protein